MVKNIQPNPIIDLNEVEYQYSIKLPIFVKLLEDAEYTLNEQLKESSIKIQPITSRIKDKQSFLDKLVRKNSTNPFEEIKDIVGLRIVCLFLSDIQKIEELIKENFEVIEIDNKIQDTNSLNTFGYMSAHYIVKIKDEYTGLRYDSIKNTPFEIQVRTISMDAWANISHFLEYKNENDIPTELKRDFNALSGLFYVADTHFEMFYKERQVNTQQINEDIEGIINKNNNLDDRKINLDSLSIYLKNKFPTREHAESKGLSSLVEELVNNGYHTIQVLDKSIDRGIDAFNEYEKENYPQSPFMDIGIVRVLLAIIDEDFKRSIYPRDGNMYEPYKKYIKD